jgi:alkylation response protein AidB-like acyl-CoA dehydrogenase
MDLSLTDDQELLQSTVRSFVQREARTEVLTGLQDSESGLRPEWLQPMAEAGWLGMLIPAAAGGSDASTLDAAIIAEELGRGPMPGPFLTSNVVAALLLGCAEPTAQRNESLESMANGEMVVSPILPGMSSLLAGDPGYLQATASEAGTLRLHGDVPFVPYAAAATHFLVPKTTYDAAGQCELLLIPAATAGVTSRRLPGFLAWNYEASFSNAAVDASHVLGGADRSSLESALRRAFLIVAAYQVGGCQALLERSVAYGNTRMQFGVPIGSFQRVQDHLVELLNALDAARWTMYEAIWHLDSGEGAPASCHMAKAVASESYLTCTDFAHKVHGGIGVDPQYGLTLYTQMARSLYEYLGHPRWHKRQMVEALAADFVSRAAP